MSELNLKLLHKLSKCYLVVDSVENFIIEYDKPYKDFTDCNTKREYFSDVMRNFNKMCFELSDKTGFSTGIITLFFKLDKRLYPKTARFSDSSLFLTSPTIIYVGYNLLGDIISHSINIEGPRVLDFFEENLDIFPTSTKKYISKKLSNFKRTKNTCLATDKFKLKTIERDLPAKPNTIFLHSYLDKIKFHEDGFESTRALFHMYELLYTKYGISNQTASFNELMKDYRDYVSYMFYSFTASSNFLSENDKVKMLLILEKQEFIVVTLMRHIMKNKWDGDQIEFLSKLNNIDDISLDKFNSYWPDYKITPLDHSDFFEAIERHR